MHSLVKIYRPDSKGKLQYVETVNPFDTDYLIKNTHRNYPYKYKKKGGGKRGVG